MSKRLRKFAETVNKHCQQGPNAGKPGPCPELKPKRHGMTPEQRLESHQQDMKAAYQRRDADHGEPANQRWQRLKETIKMGRRKNGDDLEIVEGEDEPGARAARVRRADLGQVRKWQREHEEADRELEDSPEWKRYSAASTKFEQIRRNFINAGVKQGKTAKASLEVPEFQKYERALETIRQQFLNHPAQKRRDEIVAKIDEKVAAAKKMVAANRKAKAAAKKAK